MSVSVLVHIVTFNHATVIRRALDAALASRGVPIEIVVTDNGSSDASAEIARNSGVTVRSLPNNLGFSAGHNSILNTFFESSHSHLCILNPDVAVEPDCLATVAARCQYLATPKLLRGDDTLAPVTPRTLDAAGMVLTNSLRHFDRGSQLPDAERFSHEEFVFGGTGACLLLSREAVKRLLLPRTPHDAILDQIHPGLGAQALDRPQLFDEAFFAYREDAELAWRSQRFGLTCRYVPQAVAVHKRAVLPENRSALSAFVNYLGVRNRFLLQLAHFSFRYHSAVIPGFLVRNGAVVLGVLAFERSSIAAFSDLWRLRHRSLYLRRWLKERASESDSRVARWLIQESEPC